MGVVEGVADVLASSAWFGICGGGDWVWSVF